MPCCSLSPANEICQIVFPSMDWKVFSCHSASKSGVGVFITLISLLNIIVHNPSANNLHCNANMLPRVFQTGFCSQREQSKENESPHSLHIPAGNQHFVITQPLSFVQCSLWGIHFAVPVCMHTYPCLHSYPSHVNCVQPNTLVT